MLLQLKVPREVGGGVRQGLPGEVVRISGQDGDAQQSQVLETLSLGGTASRGPGR